MQVPQPHSNLHISLLLSEFLQSVQLIGQIIDFRRFVYFVASSVDQLRVLEKVKHRPGALVDLRPMSDIGLVALGLLSPADLQVFKVAGQLLSG
jgi:hypothetical protein